MSTCESVCIGTDNIEMFTWHSVKTPVARKPYRCCECGAEIPVGQRYVKIVGVTGDSFETYRQCTPCHEIQQVFSCDGGWLIGGLWQMWDDADGFRNLTVHDKCFQKLSDETRRFLVEKWWEWKELQHG